MLTITLVILKAFEIINWSWLWVFAPMWIPLAIIGLFLSIVGTIALFTQN